MVPSRWTPATIFSYRGMRAFYNQLLGMNFAYGPKNVKICNTESGMPATCDTWDMGSVQNSFTGCIIKQGWLSARGASSTACAGAPAFDKAKANISLEDPRLLAYMYPTTRGRSVYGQAAQLAAQHYFQLPSSAQDSVWANAHSSYSGTFYFKNLTAQADLARVKALYGTFWSSAWDTLAAKGELPELDLMYMNGWNPRGDATAGPGTWNVAAHALLQYVDNRKGPGPAADVLLRVVGVVLGNSGGSTETEAYTLRRSRTAFTLAIAAVRSAFEQVLIWGGHVFQFHIIQGAAVYTFYNTIDPGVPVGLSSHPLRKVLDGFMDPVYIAQFHTGLFQGIVAPPPTAVPTFWLPRFFNLYAQKGVLGPATFFSTQPAQMVARAGLNPQLFTGITPGSQTWDKYPLAALYLKIVAATRRFAEAALGQFYPDDASVASDAALQAWVAAMLDPAGGNIKQISADNTILTREALLNFVAHLLYQTIAHNTAHTQDYAMLGLSVAHHPSPMAITTLPSPTAKYSVKQLVKAVTNTDLMSRKLNFHCAFVGSAPFTQFVPGVLNYDTGEAAPQYEADLPFAPGESSAGDAANTAVVAFRRDITRLQETEPRGLTRVTETNWGSPLMLPRSIGL